MNTSISEKKNNDVKDAALCDPVLKSTTDIFSK
jgi:hypothetical protein